MWKYKEYFVYPNLRGTPSEGELEFVLSIVEGNEKVRTSKSLQGFVQKLNKRISCEENFITLLEIYNVLIDAEGLSNVKKAIFSLIMNKPGMLRP